MLLSLVERLEGGVRKWPRSRELVKNDAHFSRMSASVAVRNLWLFLTDPKHAAENFTVKTALTQCFDGNNWVTVKARLFKQKFLLECPSSQVFIKTIEC